MDGIGSTHRFRGERTLVLTGLLYAAGTMIHTLDHLRRGTEVVTDQVYWLGTFGTVLAALAIGLALTGHRLAPTVAMVVGITHGVGISAVHLLPQWSAFSDAFPGNSVSPLSWVAVLSEIGGALAFGIAGAYRLTSTSSSSSSPPLISFSSTTPTPFA